MPLAAVRAGDGLDARGPTPPRLQTGLTGRGSRQMDDIHLSILERAGFVGLVEPLARELTHFPAPFPREMRVNNLPLRRSIPKCPAPELDGGSRRTSRSLYGSSTGAEVPSAGPCPR